MLNRVFHVRCTTNSSVRFLLFIVFLSFILFLFIYLLRRLHNEELNDLYSSPNIIRVIKSRRMRWAGHVARMGERRGAYRIMVGRLAGRRPLGRPRCRWEDNIKMDLQEVGWDGVDWIDMAQYNDRWRAVVSAVMDLRVP
jgi:hypothetical protein